MIIAIVKPTTVAINTPPNDWSVIPLKKIGILKKEKRFKTLKKYLPNHPKPDNYFSWCYSSICLGEFQNSDLFEVPRWLCLAIPVKKFLFVILLFMMYIIVILYNLRWFAYLSNHSWLTNYSIKGNVKIDYKSFQ